MGKSRCVRVEKPYAMIKPDAVRNGSVNKILQLITQKGLKIVRYKKQRRLTRKIAKKLYTEHRGAPFYREQIRLMVSGPIVSLELEGAGAIKKWRKLMGRIRARLGTSRGSVAREIAFMFGSDSRESAAREVALMFDSSNRLVREGKRIQQRTKPSRSKRRSR